MSAAVWNPRLPDHVGGGLVNLIAELEWRATGAAAAPRLTGDRASSIADADSVVLVLFDGLGVGQLGHPAAEDLRSSWAATLDAPFPTTTTVSLATIATGTTPSEHGVLAHALSLPDLGAVVNTIHMRTVTGGPIDVDLPRFIPRPTLWERLAAAGVEPVTVQPGGFTGSPLSAVLYSGARFEGYYTVEDAAAITVDVASHGGRFVFVYVPFVDVAAHMHGQASGEYRDAMSSANAVWRRLTMDLPDSVMLLGTADHGHVDIAPSRRVRLSRQDEHGLLLAGDGRALFVTGDPAPILERVPSRWAPIDRLDGLWGGPVRPEYRDRLPDGIVFPDDGWVVLARHMNHRLIGHHGGLTPAEREIPLLVRT